ncbi:unnamed protein product [Cyberlindnera jadinii]|uniref:Trafficking protein particle complex subunit n=1 Tax=Cyberlindnera jadinii (strain ATCC 18201 / CBS 1600 / BCRC 20928 / JCM 3617 / NBRC 0987 / NRRL Y-1542) TaxID=983966 RepID=A0A0H5CAP6_CYBJN|nr:Sybindin-like protein [Cyberlindnera jadinii NRRL Y-1542]ODV76278.1 Sybindin-like protein [Cyberlindnera jadinii NRRL Y-1542]CEP20929.1 unnamed protein product [Cyberlindnera jadinii]
MIQSLFILNRSGGLIYQHDLNDGLNKLSANEHLILAGTIHGVFAIASKLTPTAVKVSAQPRAQSQGSAVNGNTSGLKSIETDKFSMYIFQTLTGVKFLLVTDPAQGDLNSGCDTAENVLRKIYALYADYVMKNPFYEIDMPIRVDLFDRKIAELVKAL